MRYKNYLRHIRHINPAENSCGYLTELLPFDHTDYNHPDGLTRMEALTLVNKWNDEAIRYMFGSAQITYCLPT